MCMCVVIFLRLGTLEIVLKGHQKANRSPFLGLDPYFDTYPSSREPETGCEEAATCTMPSVGEEQDNC